MSDNAMLTTAGDFPLKPIAEFVRRKMLLAEAAKLPEVKALVNWLHSLEWNDQDVHYRNRCPDCDRLETEGHDAECTWLEIRKALAPFEEAKDD